MTLSFPDVSDVFVATTEWQEIKKGHSVPAGLHYRINLQTGLKEAKLMEEGQDKEETNGNVHICTHQF